MHDLSTVIKFGLVVMGIAAVVGGLLLGGLVVWRLTRRSGSSPDPAVREPLHEAPRLDIVPDSQRDERFVERRRRREA